MVQFFATIGKWIGKIFSKEVLPFTLTAILALSIFLNFNTCSRLSVEKEARRVEKEIYNQNFTAFLDTINKTFNKKLDAFEFDKTAYLTTLEELSQYDSALAAKLEDVKGDIINAIDTKIGVNIGKVEVDNELEKYDEENYGLKWKNTYSDPGFSQYISGVSKFKLSRNKIFPGTTLIDSNIMNLNITYGFRELEGKYKVWAVSESPMVTLNELTGAYFIDKPPPYTTKPQYLKRWIVGPYIGYGVNFSNKFEDARLGWSFGISLQYHLFGFGKKPIKQKKSKGSSLIPSTDDILNGIQ